MCSHESVTWKVVPNTVTDRMTDNSLIHKFIPSRVISRRTKLLNNKVRNLNVKDYRQYIQAKTAILRNLSEDTDTDDTSNLTDMDYSAIYNSYPESKKKTKSNTEPKKNSQECVNTNMTYSSLNEQHHISILNNNDEGDVVCDKYEYSKVHCSKGSPSIESNNTIFSQMKFPSIDRETICNHKSLYKTANKSDLASDTENDTISHETDSVNKGAIQREKNIVHESNDKLLSQISMVFNKIENINKDVVYNQRDLSTPINMSYSVPHSQDNTIFCDVNLVEQNTIQNCRDSSAIIKELTFQTHLPNSRSQICNEMNTVQCHSDTVVNKSNSENINSQNNANEGSLLNREKSISKSTINDDDGNLNTYELIADVCECKIESDNYDVTLPCKTTSTLKLRSYKDFPPKLTSLEKINKPFLFSDKEFNKSEVQSIEKLTKVHESTIDMKHLDDTSVNHKTSKSLDSVKRNLISMLDNIECINKIGDIDKTQNTDDRSNYDRLLLCTVSILLREKNNKFKY